MIYPFPFFLALNWNPRTFALSDIDKLVFSLDGEKQITQFIVRFYVWKCCQLTCSSNSEGIRVRNEFEWSDVD